MNETFNIHWRGQGQWIRVVTSSGSYTLHNPDAQTRADLLAMVRALIDAGRGVAGAWPNVFARGWLDG